MRSCVEFSRRAFKPWKHVRFEHLDVKNSVYNPEGDLDPLTLRLPIDDGTTDRVIFNSVFTHIERMEAARHYLDETMRILKPGGLCWCTWFRSPPNMVCADAGRTVFREADIIEAVKAFQVLFTAGGTSGSFHDQWFLILAKP
jgi:ubiquinone/menaquinone biosynthesis C-methylase UbiE